MLSKINISIALLISTHLFGVGSVLFGDAQQALSLTPFNLCLTAFVIAINDPKLGRSWVFLLTYVVGFAVELIGVNTGFPFGTYTYGPVLGIKWMNTPLMIGLNWLILLYATNAIAASFKASFIIRALISACLMVILDFFIEPVAIAYDFWTWAEAIPPMSNYIAWFLVALLLSLVWQNSKVEYNRPMAFAVYAVELFFFLALFFALNIN